MYREINLDQSILEYFKERFSAGHSLAHYILQRTDLETGKIFTFFPSELNILDEVIKAKDSVEFGGIFPKPPSETHIKINGGIMVPVPNTNSYLAQIIYDFLNKQNRGICIFEEALAKPTDQGFVRKNKSPFVTFRDEIFYILQSKLNNLKDRIERIILDATEIYPGTIGVLSSISDESQFEFEKQIITLDQIKHFAETADKIILGAYDGESYLIWTKR